MSNKLYYKGYTAEIYVDVDDNLLCGYIENIKDSINFHTDKVSEIENQFHQAVDNYLEMCKHYGKEPDS
jgi:predicted HicB family RNase H-like nuclease